MAQPPELLLAQAAERHCAMMLVIGFALGILVAAPLVLLYALAELGSLER